MFKATCVFFPCATTKRFQFIWLQFVNVCMLKHIERVRNMFKRCTSSSSTWNTSCTSVTQYCICIRLLHSESLYVPSRRRRKGEENMKKRLWIVCVCLNTQTFENRFKRMKFAWHRLSGSGQTNHPINFKCMTRTDFYSIVHILRLKKELNSVIFLINI